VDVLRFCQYLSVQQIGCNNLKLGYLPKWFDVPVRISEDIDVVMKALGKAKD